MCKILVTQPLEKSSFTRNTILSIMEDDEKFEIALDVTSYKPEELKVFYIKNQPNESKIHF